MNDLVSRVSFFERRVEKTNFCATTSNDHRQRYTHGEHPRGKKCEEGALDLERADGGHWARGRDWFGNCREDQEREGEKRNDQRASRGDDGRSKSV